MKPTDFFKQMPSVGELLEHPQLKAVVGRLNASTVSTRVRSFLDELRDEVTQRAEELPLPSVREVIDRVARYVAGDEGWRLTSVVNATGRFRGGPWASAPLPEAAIERAMLLSKDFSAASPDGGVTDDAVAELVRLTGAEAAAVFHSRVGSLSLTLAELACQPPLVIARGDLGEVAPGCRLTDLCNAAGARMREVGATDAVTPADYAAALTDAGDDAGVVLRLAPEAFRMVGVAPRPETADVAAVIKPAGAVLIEDLGGAPLVDLPTSEAEGRGPAIEGINAPSAAAVLQAGADLVLVRGEGVVGGPECCMVLGSAELVSRLTRNPIAAAYQPSAATAAALATTLAELREPSRAMLTNPILSLLSAPLANLRQRAERLAPQIVASPAVASAEVIERDADAAAVAGIPFAAPTVAISVTPADGTAEALAETLAGSGPPAVWGEVVDGRLLLDLRTVFPRQDLAIVSAFPPPDGDPAPTGEEAR